MEPFTIMVAFQNVSDLATLGPNWPLKFCKFLFEAVSNGNGVAGSTKIITNSKIQILDSNEILL